MNAADYCSQRALILSNVILKLSEHQESSMDLLKGFTMKTFVQEMEQYKQPRCNFTGSSIIAESSDLFEIMSNLDVMEQAYLFLSATVLSK